MNEPCPYIKIRKFFIKIEKEEKWLNDMSAQGWNLLQVSELGGYTFLYGLTEKRRYRIDYRVFKNQNDFDDYTTLFWDSGWNLVSGGKERGNQYFYSTNFEESSDIFSDERSKADRYMRMARHTLAMTLLICLPYLSIWWTDIWRFSLSPYQQYQVSELSHQTGFEYFNTFMELAVPLFLQYSLCICMVLMFLLCIYCAIKARVYHHRAMKKNL